MALVANGNAERLLGFSAKGKERYEVLKIHDRDSSRYLSE
jgi:hypothetical protein